jgi:hypothetical protein
MMIHWSWGCQVLKLLENQTHTHIYIYNNISRKSRMKAWENVLDVPWSTTLLGTGAWTCRNA